MVVPYTEEKGIRTFLSGVDEKDLVWHRDIEDRYVEVLEGDGWQFQYDDCLPFSITSGDRFTIKKMEYHRLIKGDGDLTIRIIKDAN